MTDEDFKMMVVKSLGEIQTTLLSNAECHEDHEDRLRELKTAVDTAKGGWLAFGALSALISAVVVGICKYFKL